MSKVTLTGNAIDCRITQTLGAGDLVDSLVITSVRTGSVITVRNIISRWESFTPAQRDLVNLLTDVASGMVQTLTADDVKIALSMGEASKATSTPGVDSPASGPDKATLAPPPAENTPESVTERSEPMSVVAIEQTEEEKAMDRPIVPTVDVVKAIQNDTVAFVTDARKRKHSHVASGIDEIEKVYNRLRTMSERIAKEEYYIIHIDLPTEFNRMYKTMHKICTRFAYSDWITTKEGLANPALQEALTYFRKHAKRLRIVGRRLDENAMTHREVAEDLDDYIRETHKLLIVNLEAVSGRYQKTLAELNAAVANGESDSPAAREDAEKKYHQETRNKLNDARERIEIAIRDAQRFDMSEDFRDLLSAVRNVLAARVDEFNVVARDKGIKRAETPPVVK